MNEDRGQRRGRIDEVKSEIEVKRPLIANGVNMTEVKSKIEIKCRLIENE